MTRIFTFLIVLFFAVGSAHSQYYYLPFPSAGQNPNGLNSDDEYPVGGGLDASWTVIKGPSATPSWSTAITLPITFSFNGNPVSSFKVSTTGIVTFDVGTGLAAPSSTSQTLPSASIPDNSICAWGLQGTGSNDNVVAKTFGSAPNRQYWIFFTSYSIPGNASGWTYWSIVLEETTNNIYIVDQRTNGTLHMSLGIQVNNTTAVNVVGSPNIVTLGSNDPTVADNSYYKFIYGTQNANEIELTTLTTSQFVVAPANVNVTGQITNLGSSAITSFDLKYLANGTTYTDNITGVNIPFSGTYSFTHATPLSVSAPGGIPVKVWVEMAGDANHVNDTLNTLVSGLAFLPAKKVVFEEATGTWCGWCPRGTVYMDSLRNIHPNEAMLIAVHNSDPMEVAAYDTWMGTQIGGYPSGVVDRKSIDVDPSQFIALYNQHINDISPVEVQVTSTYNQSNNFAWITVSTNWAGDAAGDFRIALVLTEDGVTGTGSGYNQSNYYSYQSQNIALQGAGHDWQAEPNPVPAADMVYDHVARAIPAGISGIGGVIPSVVTANGTYSYSFGYQIPATWDITQLHAIGMVIDNNTGQILNANSNSFVTGIAENSSESFKIRVFPNPVTETSGQVFVNLKKSSPVVFEVTDILGKVVRSNTSDLNAGEYLYPLNMSGLENGVYNVRVMVGQETLTERIILSK